MARTKQSAPRGSRIVWQQRAFIDHAGSQATLGVRTVSSNIDEDLQPSPAFAFQVYSTVPLDTDHTKLLRYLASEFDSIPHASFEIYAQQPDVFACMEHQRREIAHRKTSTEGTSTTRDHDSQVPNLPGIAKVVADDRHLFREGFLLVINSNSYQDSSDRYPVELETGPLWVTFNRKFPFKTFADQTSRLEIDPVIAKRDLGVDREELEVYPEANEINVRRCENIQAMRSGLEIAFRRSRCGEDDVYGYDYGLGEDEGQPRARIEFSSAELALKNQAETLPLGQRFNVTDGPGEAITVTSSPSPMETDLDLRYIVYVPFLCGPGEDDRHNRLNIMARAFSSTLASHLPLDKNKTIHLEFHKPPDASFTSIIDLHRAILRSRPGMSVGALVYLHQTRVHPCSRNPYHRQHNLTPYKTFAVVLDKPDFVNESGVLFVLTDGGKPTRELSTFAESMQYIHGANYNETMVWRSAGMPEVASRLGMFVLEE